MLRFSNDTSFTEQRNHANRLRSVAFHAAVKSAVRKFWYP
jgi:hypothetical protein